MSAAIVSEICRLAAELADEVEREQPGEDAFGYFEMKFVWPRSPYEQIITEPVTLIYQAKWQAGEWKYTKRTRLEELA